MTTDYAVRSLSANGDFTVVRLGSTDEYPYTASTGRINIGAEWDGNATHELYGVWAASAGWVSVTKTVSGYEAHDGTADGTLTVAGTTITLGTSTGTLAASTITWETGTGPTLGSMPAEMHSHLTAPRLP